MGAEYHGIPTELASRLRREFGVKAFVESGLGQGTTALWAEKYFDKVISIENDSALIEKFMASHLQSNVEIIRGDSGEKMAEVVKGLDEPALFWLDGHTDDYTPILQELAAINASRLTHIIMVDDMRMFGSGAWPNPFDVRQMAQDNDRRVTWTIGDVMLALPHSMAKRARTLI